MEGGSNQLSLSADEGIGGSGAQIVRGWGRALGMVFQCSSQNRQKSAGEASLSQTPTDTCVENKFPLLNACFRIFNIDLCLTHLFVDSVLSLQNVNRPMIHCKQWWDFLKLYLKQLFNIIIRVLCILIDTVQTTYSQIAQLKQNNSNILCKIQQQNIINPLIQGIYQIIYQMADKQYWLIVICIAITLIQIAYILYATYSSLYFPIVNAPYTQIISMMFGIFATFLAVKIQNKKVERRINLIWGILIILVGLITSIVLIICKIYVVCLIWVIAGIKILASQKKKHQKLHGFQVEFSEIKDTSMLTGLTQHNADTVVPSISESTLPTKKKTNICNNLLCCINSFLILLITANAIAICYYHTAFPILGDIYKLKLPLTNQSISFHAYCSEITNSKYPTVVLEHGGGGNMAGFMPLVSSLKQRGIKTCIYDRLGYGRSSKVVPNVNPQYKAQITNLLLSKLLSQNEKIIMGGWSAGVELSLVYQYYYPEQVAGMVFIDGYPDYLTLGAVAKNASEIEDPHTELIANIFRVIQPFGLGLFFGGNPIQDKNLNQYYEAYYRTGYLWDSQAVELHHLQTTQWLSRLAKSDQALQPYPNRQIYLNWPDTKVPLLVMPAEKTYQDDMYRIQSTKYIEKCKAKNKLRPVAGAHQYVLIEQETVANQIFDFFKPTI